MADRPSLNQQITAAWSTNTSTTPKPKKRTRVSIPINSSVNGNGSEASTSSRDATNPTPETTAATGSAEGASSAGTSTARRPRKVMDPAQLAAKYAPPALRFASLGGLEPQITQLLEFVALPLLQPATYEAAGVPRPGGVLLHGVPGGGKTQLIKCLAGELGLPFISVSAPSIVAGMSGESEKTLRDLFDEAKKLAPCLVFLDEVDAITPKRETAQREMERRIVAQLLTLMDDLSGQEEPVIVLAATNRPDSLDPALRRPGRFDHEIEMGVPNQAGREEILRVLCSKQTHAPDVDLRSLAKATPGYVGADLTALTRAAGTIALKRNYTELSTADNDPNGSAAIPIPIDGARFSELPPSVRDSPIARFLTAHPTPLTRDELSTFSVSAADFTAALKIVQPSAKREGFATVPDVTWADVGALGQVRHELYRAIVSAVRHPEVYAAFGIKSPSGVLLWGPPGCGKTLLAKAVANESRANFISVKGPELLNKYVGESEKAIRQVFARARASAPCVIFFDEMDALVPKRDDALSDSSARVVNTILTELDGLDSRKDVHVIGATNRPDMIDSALIRPGRLDKRLYVDLPSPSERVDILKTCTKETPVDPESWSSISEIVQSATCDGFSGADIDALVREAVSTAMAPVLQAVSVAEQAGLDATLNANGDASTLVTVEHFRQAAQKTTPSVSREQRQKYERMRARYAGLPSKARIMEAELPAGGEVQATGDLLA